MPKSIVMPEEILKWVVPVWQRLGFGVSSAERHPFEGEAQERSSGILTTILARIQPNERKG